MRAIARAISRPTWRPGVEIQCNRTGRAGPGQNRANLYVLLRAKRASGPPLPYPAPHHLKVHNNAATPSPPPPPTAASATATRGACSSPPAPSRSRRRKKLSAISLVTWMNDTEKRMISILPDSISSAPACTRAGRMARELRARGEGNARAGVGLSSGWHTPPSSAAKRYITCHDAMRISVRALDRDMQRGDAHVICERERGRAGG